MYQSYYNLTGKPFRLSPDPEFFFPSRGHKRALAYLRYGLNQNEGFVVITGAPGTGKTTLAQILLQEMGEKNVVVAHLTTTQLEADDMLRMVAASFGLRYENLDKAALLKTIETFLLARSREQKRALLVIDESQNLPARSLEELRMLSNLQVGDKALLQTFLLGQAQFRQMLDHPDLEQLRQRVIANYHLSPLAADEGQRYIESRLKQVGWDNDPHFAELAFELIHEYTEGVPRRINMLCDRILLFGCMEEKREVTRELVNLVIEELEQEISGAPLKPETFDELSAQPQPPVITPVQKQAAQEKTATANNVSANNVSANNVPANKKSPQTTVSANSGQQKTPQSTAKKAAAPTESEKPAESALIPKAEASKPDAAIALETTNQLANKLKNITRPEPQQPVESIPQSEGSLLYDKLHGGIADDDELFIEITEDFNNQPVDESEPPVSAESHSQQKQNTLSSAQASTSAEINQTPERAETSKANQTETRSTGRAEERESAKNHTVKAQKELSEKIPSKPEEESQETEHSEQVMGNTIKQKQHDKAAADQEAAGASAGGAAQFSERELFRVIPGGKNANKDNAAEAGQDASVAPAAHASPSNEDVVLRRILRLVLAFHRSPSSFPGLDDPSQPLPEGVSELLELSVADDQVLTKVSPAAVMGISPVMLRAAVRFFVRRTLFVANDTDHFRILGLPSGASLGRIERHYDLLMRLLRQDKQPGASDCVAKVGKAYEALTRNGDITVAEKDENKAVQQDDNTINENTADKTAAVLLALENPKLTIDFGEEIKAEKPTPHISTIIGQDNEGYTPDPRVTRRRIHLLGQAAILGIGALVIVLGLFITQLEPTELESSNKPALSAGSSQGARDVGAELSRDSVASSSDAENQTDQRLDLSFSDAAEDKLQQREDEMFGTRATEKNAAKRSDANARRQTNDGSIEAGTESSTLAMQESAAEFVAPVAKAPRSTTSKSATNSIASLETEKRTTTEAVKPDISNEAMTTSSILSSAVEVPVNTPSPATSAISSSESTSTATRLNDTKFKPVPVQPRASATTELTNTEFGTTTELSTEKSPMDATSSSRKFAAVPIQDKPTVQTSPELPQVAPQTSTAIPAPKQFEGKDIPLSSESETTPVILSEPQVVDIEPFDPASPDAQSPAAGTATPTGELPKIVLPVDQLAAAPAAAISEQALNDLLIRYTEAYQAGDAAGVMSIFAAKARTNDQSSRAGIESDYDDLFSKTSSRRIAISDLFWEKEEDFARGVGKYKATILQRNELTPRVFEGKLTLQVHREANGELKISRFYFSNQVVTSNPKAPTAPLGVSQAELKKLLTGFSRHYENGDVDKLMKLFANNARTNDQYTLAGIRKDHVDLFNSTEVRQMFLKNTRWKIKENTASGDGRFEVMIQNKGEANFSSVSGRFTIDVEKTPRGVLITKFLHQIQ